MEDQDAAKIVNPGGCFLGDELVHCALEAKQCNGKLFRSHRELQGTPHQEECDGWFSTHRGDHIGMCVSEMENFVCTGHTSNCALPYADHIPYCNLVHNHHPEAPVPYSLYGMCIPPETEVNQKFKTSTDSGGWCVWSVDDCPEEATYVPAFQQVSVGEKFDHGNLCTCDKVKVGACVQKKTGYFACAVSEDSCDPDSKFKNWQKVEEFGKECRLCDAFDKDAHVEKYNSANHHLEDGKCNVVGASLGGIVSGATLGILVMVLAKLYLPRRKNARECGVPEPTETDNEILKYNGDAAQLDFADVRIG